MTIGQCPHNFLFVPRRCFRVFTAILMIQNVQNIKLRDLCGNRALLQGGFVRTALQHNMKMELAQQIMVLRQQGVTRFSVACDYGIGLYAAEIINALRNDEPELMLFCVTPYEEQATKWTPELRERYFDMLIKCTHMTAASLHKQPDAQLEAYRTIIRQSDMVLAVYDPASARGDDTDKAISYARELHRPMLMIHPDTLKTTYSCVEV